MIEVYTAENNFENKTADNLLELEEEIRKGGEHISKVPFDKILLSWAELGKKIIRSPELISTEGILFLANWLKEENLRNLVHDTLNIREYDKDKVSLKTGGFMRAFPRGLVCHWVAGNIQTLPILSIVQSSLVKNSNIVRVSRRNIDTTLKILKTFKKLSENLPVKDILASIAIIYFSHEDKRHQEQFSKIADCKVIWGGSTAIASIKKLPEKDSCETIIFGPKYSFSVVDAEIQQDTSFEELLGKLALDIVLFDQMACSSSQAVFFEKSKIPLKDIAVRLAGKLEQASKKYPKHFLDENIASKIINKRAEYLLNPNLDVIKSEENDWTILIGGEFKLEEAIQSKTIFIKQVDSLEEIQNLITPKIQTIGLLVKDKTNREKLANLYLYKGASRCVKPGQMNDYDTPWDGLLFIDRLVRWGYCYES